jgi:hypothetical protein
VEGGKGRGGMPKNGVTGFWFLNSDCDLAACAVSVFGNVRAKKYFRCNAAKC